MHKTNKSSAIWAKYRSFALQARLKLKFSSKCKCHANRAIAKNSACFSCRFKALKIESVFCQTNPRFNQFSSKHLTLLDSTGLKIQIWSPLMTFLSLCKPKSILTQSLLQIMKLVKLVTGLLRLNLKDVSMINPFWVSKLFLKTVLMDQVNYFTPKEPSWQKLQLIVNLCGIKLIKIKKALWVRFKRDFTNKQTW